MQCATAQGESLLTEMIAREPARLTARIGRIIHDQTNAEDLAQETLLRALHGLDKLQSEPTPPVMCAWLDRIARNVAYNWVRDQGRRPLAASLDAAIPGRALPLAQSLPDPGLDPAGTLVAADSTAALVQLVENLPPPLKQVFLLRDLEELSTADTARLLGIQEGLVKWRLHKARQLLRNGLTPLSRAAI